MTYAETADTVTRRTRLPQAALPTLTARPVNRCGRTVSENKKKQKLNGFRAHGDDEIESKNKIKIHFYLITFLLERFPSVLMAIKET